MCRTQDRSTNAWIFCDVWTSDESRNLAVQVHVQSSSQSSLASLSLSTLYLSLVDYSLIPCLNYVLGALGTGDTIRSERNRQKPCHAGTQLHLMVGGGQ